MLDAKSRIKKMLQGSVLKSVLTDSDFLGINSHGGTLLCSLSMAS